MSSDDGKSCLFNGAHGVKGCHHLLKGFDLLFDVLVIGFLSHLFLEIVPRLNVVFIVVGLMWAYLSIVVDKLTSLAFYLTQLFLIHKEMFSVLFE